MILGHKLPTVLTAPEIGRLLDATPDIKYKAMFAAMYSSGMRVSEVIHLHYDDIPAKTNPIWLIIFSAAETSILSTDIFLLLLSINGTGHYLLF